MSRLRWGLGAVLALVSLIVAASALRTYVEHRLWLGGLTVVVLVAIDLFGFASLALARRRLVRELGGLAADPPAGELLDERLRRLKALHAAGVRPDLEALAASSAASELGRAYLGKYLVAVTVLVGLVGTFGGLMETLRSVAPLLADFLHEHPAMSAELLLLDRVVDLLEEGLDLAVRIGELPDSTLVAVPLGSTARVVCASPVYLQRHGRPVVPADLAGHRCVRFSGLAPGTEWEFAAGGRRIGVSVAGTLATNQIDAALAACTAGLGCGRFLGYQVSQALAEGSLVRLLTEYEPPPLPIHLLYPHARLLSPRVRSFVDWVVPRLRGRGRG